MYRRLKTRRRRKLPREASTPSRIGVAARSRTERDARPALIWVKAREDALEPITLHERRHSAASYLIEAGLNDLELTSMIGHSDPRTTKMIYGHLFGDSSEKVAAKLDTYLGRQGDPQSESIAT